MPDIPGAEHCISSDGFFELAEMPKRVLVIGGGYIAAEFAGVFGALKADTTWAFRHATPLRHFDQIVRDTLMTEYSSR